eukprot:813377-Alexandrium_andersonii.AAC.1
MASSIEHNCVSGYCSGPVEEFCRGQACRHVSFCRAPSPTRASLSGLRPDKTCSSGGSCRASGLTGTVGLEA